MSMCLAAVLIFNFESITDNKILFVSLSLITVTFVLFLAFDCRMTLVEEFKVILYIL